MVRFYTPNLDEACDALNIYKMKAEKAHGFNRGMIGRQLGFSLVNLYNYKVTMS